MSRIIIRKNCPPIDWCPKKCPPKCDPNKSLVLISDCDGDTQLTTMPNGQDLDFIQGSSPNGFVLLYDNTNGTGTVPISGPGDRFLYHSFKSALRSGGVSNGQWDDLQIGKYSTAFGFNPIASGDDSFATGFADLTSTLSASGFASFSSGLSSTNSIIDALAPVSFVRGSANNSIIRSNASANTSFINARSTLNSTVETNAPASAIFGLADNGSTLRAGLGPIIYPSFLRGVATSNSTIESIAPGSDAYGVAASNSTIRSSGEGARAGGSAALNSTIEAVTVASIVEGRAENGGRLRTVGGFGQGARVSGYATGSFGADFSLIESSSAGSDNSGFATNTGKIINNGPGSVTKGFADSGGIIQTDAVSAGGFAWGSARDLDSIIETIGEGTEASGLTESGIIRAIGDASHGYGVSSFGAQVLATGRASEARSANIDDEITNTNAEASTAYGRSLIIPANNRYSLLIGKYATAKTISNPPLSNTISGEGSFQIGGGQTLANTTGAISVVIGTSTFSDANAIGGGNADFWNTNGADYAEYFEWHPIFHSRLLEQKIDRIGYFVSLSSDSNHGDKIEIASTSEDVIGILSSQNGSSGYIGDCAEKAWSGSLLRDDFGRVQTYLDYLSPIKTILSGSSVVQNENYPKFCSLIEASQTRPGQNENKVQSEDIFKVLISKLLIECPLMMTKQGITQEAITLTEEQKEKLRNVLTDEKYQQALHQTLEQKQTVVKNIEGPLTDEVKNKLLNVIPLRCAITSPKYDPNVKYQSRAARSEWSVVGLLGKLYVRDDGTCKVGQKCECLNGIATLSKNKKGWHVLKRMSPNVIRIMFK